MNAAAFVEDAWEYGGVRIAVFPHRGPDVIRALNFADAHVETIIPTPETAGVRREPSWLHLEESAARALFDALGRHFGGAPETVTLRKDYEAERARVDLLIQYATCPPVIVNGSAVTS